MPRRAPPERCNGKIVLAIIVEVRRLDIGDAGPLVEPESSAELSLAQPAQPDDGPLLVVGGKEGSHVADEQVTHTVAVDIDVGRVRRIRDAGDDRHRRARRGRAAEDDALPHVSAEHVEATVTVEVHQGDVRDRW